MSKLIYIIVFIFIISIIVVASKYNTSLFKYDKNIAAQDFIKKYVNGEEARLGASCNKLKGDAENYFHNSIEPMILKGKEGGDWWRIINQRMVDDLIKYERYMEECWVIYSGADRYDELRTKVNYKEFFEILSGIKTIVMYTDFNVANKNNFNKEYMYLEKYYIRWKKWINNENKTSNTERKTSPAS